MTSDIATRAAPDAGIALPALDGRQPLGFLAALGALRLLAENGDPDARVSWSPTTFTAILHTTIAEDARGIAVVLNQVLHDNADTRIPSMPDNFPPPEPAPDKLRTTPPGLAARVAEWQSRAEPGLVADWVRALVTDLALDRKGNAETTPLAAPSGKQSFGTMFTKATDAARSRSDSVYEALVGWHRVDKYTGEYLDHLALLDAADAPSGKSSERGVPGATWLALMALPLMPVTADDAGRRRGTGWQYVARAEVMRWPLWRDQLEVHAARYLLDHPAVALDATGELTHVHRAQLGRLGVFAVAVAARVRLPGRNFDGVLTPKRCILLPSQGE